MNVPVLSGIPVRRGKVGTSRRVTEPMVGGISHHTTNLVGGFNPSEKYQSVGIIIPNIWKKTYFKSTNQKYSPNHGKKC
jgi:hypothetical protein